MSNPPRRSVHHCLAALALVVTLAPRASLALQRLEVFAAAARERNPAALEAARGMGMSPWQVLARVELPLAWPVLVAGIRTAAVVNVGTAALATFVGAGGLGAIIEVGIDNQRDRVLYAGASLTAVLALAADWAVAALAALTTRSREA